VKQVMMDPVLLDPLTKELVYIAYRQRTAAASTRTAAARAKGLSDEQYAEFLAASHGCGNE